MEVRPGYKQTEVGVIPEDWDLQHLGQVTGITTGRKDVNEGNPSGEYPFFTCSREPTFSDSYSFDAEAILIAGNGDVGNLHYYSGKFEAYQRTYVLSRFAFDVGYIWHQLDYRLVRSLGLGKIGTSIPYIKKENLTGFSFPVPMTDAEQRAIATALSDVDALLGGLDRLIVKKRDIKQAAMQQLLTGQARLPGSHGNWEVKRLGNVADVIDPHPSHRAPGEVPNGVPFVGIGDLDEAGNIVGKKLRLVSPDVLREHASRYDVNDELIGLGRVASIGKVVSLKHVTDRYAISPTLGVIRGREAKRNYLVYALKSRFVIQQFTKIMSGSTRSSVGMEVLRELNVRLPPSEQEQDAIAAVLSDMDAELGALEARRAKTRDLKQAMMQELLTGKTRLVTAGGAHV